MGKRRKQDLIGIISQFISDETEDCIFYPITNEDGYGDIQYYNEDDKKRHCLAHRLSYEVANNTTISSDELVLHSCDNPGCVNPKHLRLGTHQENIQDRDSRNRQAKGKSNGRYSTGYYATYDKVEKPKASFEELFSRKLSEEKVIILKEAIKNRGSKSLRVLSEEFEVSYSTMRDLSCGRIYNNV